MKNVSWCIKMKIKSIKREKFKGKVYNFHCTPNENYFSENMLVHNCYKMNNPNGKNMSLETFKQVIDRMLPTDEQAGITQVAFGADATGTSNPDMFKMMDYCREKEITPNITLADISDEIADELIKRVGAVAVSRYDDADVCYDSVKKLTDRGLTQTNIHVMISEETYDNAMQTMKDYKEDERLSKLNAIVFLSLKTKGRGVGHHQLSQEKFNSLIEYAFANEVPIGFDSCSAHKFLTAIKGRKDYKQLSQCVEACESTLLSSYISVDAEFFPCSFAEKTEGWETGINVLEYESFINVWNHERVKEFRSNLLKCGRNCSLYKI